MTPRIKLCNLSFPPSAGAKRYSGSPKCLQDPCAKWFPQHSASTQHPKMQPCLLGISEPSAPETMHQRHVILLRILTIKEGLSHLGSAYYPRKRSCFFHTLPEIGVNSESNANNLTQRERKRAEETKPTSELPRTLCQGTYQGHWSFTYRNRWCLPIEVQQDRPLKCKSPSILTPSYLGFLLGKGKTVTTFLCLLKISLEELWSVTTLEWKAVLEMHVPTEF